MEAYGRAVLVHFNFKIKILDFAYACNNISRYLVEKGRIQKSEQKQAIRYMLEEYNKVVIHSFLMNIGINFQKLL
jgi:hypothetical protein